MKIWTFNFGLQWSIQIHPNVLFGRNLALLIQVWAKLPTLCLYRVGQNTFSHQIMTKDVQQQLLHQMHFFLYLLSQLSLYPKPSQYFASDIAKHIADSLQHFRDYVQLNVTRGNKISYGMISSMELCLSYIQLALQKSTHSEHWLANVRQNKKLSGYKLGWINKARGLSLSQGVGPPLSI